MSYALPSHRTCATAALTLSLLVSATSSGAHAQFTHKDPKFGFTIRVPRDFKSVPINMDEKWIVAKFQYKRVLEPKNSEWWFEHTPEIRVIVFPKVDVKEVAAARARKKKEIAGKNKNGKVRVVNVLEHLQNPFRNYKEYLRENYKDGGWFVEKQQKMKIGGMPAVKKIIRVEDKMRSGVKYSLLAWEIDYGDATYVVQLNVLRDYDHKFRGAMKKAVTGFKKIPRTQGLRSAITGNGPSKEDKADADAWAKDRKLTPEERRKAREADLAHAITRAKEAMTKGWKTFDAPPFTVFYSTSPRFAKRVAKQAGLLWDWMHKNFGYIGDGFSVGGILRCCRSSSEARSYQDTSTRSGSTYTRREVVVADDKDWGWNDSGSGRLNAKIAVSYLDDKNRRLWYGLPPWLDDGLQLYIRSLRIKNGRLIARPDEWDMDAIRNKLRAKKFKPAKSLLTATYADYNSSGMSDGSDRIQSLAMVFFLMEKGRKHAKYKKVIPDYLKALDRRLREVDKAQDEAKKTVHSAEESKKWRQGWMHYRDKIYRDLAKEIFGDWKPSDWKKFDTAWKKAFK